MLFDLMRPWSEWIVWTPFNKRMLYPKLDTGATLTLIGIDNARTIGLNTIVTTDQPCVRFSGVSGKADGCAFQIPCKSLPFGNTKLPCSFVYVPFEYIVDKKENKLRFRYITHDKFLVGTDILNNYDISVIFNKSLFGNNVESAQLELKTHDLRLPSPKLGKGFTFTSLAPRFEEIEGLIVDCAELAPNSIVT
jgi:hypothetical protein